MVQRLRAEHRYFRLELIQIEEASEVSPQKAIEMLKEIKKPPTACSRRRGKNHASYNAFVNTFGDEIRKHFLEEEEIVFPLALKADSM